MRSIRKVWLAAYGDFVEPMYGVSPVGAYGALTKADLPEDWPFVYNPELEQEAAGRGGIAERLPDRRIHFRTRGIQIELC